MSESDGFENSDPQQQFELAAATSQLFSLATRQALRLLDDARMIADSITPIDLYAGCNGKNQLLDGANLCSSLAIKGLNRYKTFRAERKLSKAESILGITLPNWLEKY